MRFLLLHGIEWTNEHQATVAICGGSLVVMLLTVLL